MDNFIKIILIAAKKVPVIKYVLGLAAIISLIGLAIANQLDLRVAVVGTIIVLILMYLLIILSKASTSPASSPKSAFRWLTWAFINILIIIAALFVSCWFFDKPKTISQLVSFESADFHRIDTLSQKKDSVLISPAIRFADVSSTYSYYMHAGDSARDASEFKKAKQLYSELDSHLNEWLEDPLLEMYHDSLRIMQWKMKDHLATTYTDEGARVDGPTGTALLAQAVALLQSEMQVFTLKDYPDRWAGAQNNLGNALQQMGIRSQGPKAADLLGQAIAAYHEALRVYTYKDYPQDWAMIQNNLGAVLYQRSIHLKDSAEVLLSQAVTAYRNALLVYTRKKYPEDWAMALNDQGMILLELGTRTAGSAGIALLLQAVNNFRAAQEIYTKQDHPLDWAMSANNMGYALYEQGSRTKDTVKAMTLIIQSVNTLNAAVKVLPKSRFPQDWARAESNLADARYLQGTLTKDSVDALNLLIQAEEAARSTQEIYTKEAFPQDWARMRFTLGEALMGKGTRIGGRLGTALLLQAEGAFLETEEIYTREAFPREWAKAEKNLELIHRQLGDVAVHSGI